MAECVTSLGALPPSVLCLITRLLPLDATVNLIKLSGDKGLYQRGTSHGGITDVLVTTASSRGSFLLNFPNLALFPHLQCLIITKEVSFTPPIGWITTLPRHMREIRLVCQRSFPLMTRPLHDVSLLTIQNYICSSSNGTLIPINVLEWFPQLRVLQLEKSSQRWRLSSLCYFLEHLPPSLTCLTLSWPWYYNHQSWYTDLVRSISHLTELETLNLDGNTFSPLTVRGFLRDPSIIEKIELDKEGKLAIGADHLAPMVRNLRELKLRPLDDAVSLCLLRHFDCLEHLSIKINVLTTHTFVLPPTVTYLHLNTQNCDDTDFSASLLQSVPRLLKFTLRIVQHGSNAMSFPYLPPLLQALSISISQADSDSTLPDTMPESLTELMLYTRISADKYAVICKLPRLRTLKLGDNTFMKQESLPPLLTSLQIAERIPFDALALFPSGLKEIAVSVTLEERHAEQFLAIKHWSYAALTKRICELHFPHVINDLDFEVQPIASLNFQKALLLQEAFVQGLELLDTDSVHPLVTYSFFDSLSDSVDQALPLFRGQSWHVHFDGIPSNIRVFSYNHGLRPLLSSLVTKGLANRIEDRDNLFNTATLNRKLYSFTAKQESLLFTQHPLPTSLEELKLYSPEVLYKDAEPTKEYIYPFLRILPRLSKLTLSSIESSPQSYFLLNLPDTLTSLHLLYSFGLKRSLVPTFRTEEERKSWLPLLRDFSLRGCSLSLRDMLPRLSSLTSLDVRHIYVHSGLLPRFEHIKYFDQHSVNGHCLSQLIPPRFRNNNMEFFLEKDQSFRQLLPDDLESMRWEHSDEDPFVLDLFSHIPPNLRHLDVSHPGLKLSAQGMEPPRCLETLAITIGQSGARFAPNWPRFFNCMPPTLTYLYLNLHFSAVLDEALVSSLPRSLIRLAIRGSLETHLLAFLPPSLTYLSLPNVQITRPDCIPQLAALPHSVQYLESDSDVLNLPNEIERARLSSQLHALLPGLFRFSSGNLELVIRS